MLTQLIFYLTVPLVYAVAGTCTLYKYNKFVYSTSRVWNIWYVETGAGTRINRLSHTLQTFPVAQLVQRGPDHTNTSFDFCRNFLVNPKSHSYMFVNNLTGKLMIHFPHYFQSLVSLDLWDQSEIWFKLLSIRCMH